MSIKTHLAKHRTKYFIGGVIVGAGIGFYFGWTRGSALSVSQQANFSWRPKMTQTIEVYVEALDDPGNIIQCLETGTVYASQGQAARELGVSPSVVSKHLGGLLENAKGLHFVKLGKAAVSQK